MEAKSSAKVDYNLNTFEIISQLEKAFHAKFNARLSSFILR